MSIYSKTFLIILSIALTTLMVYALMENDQNHQVHTVFEEQNTQVLDNYYNQFMQTVTFSLKSYAANIAKDREILESFEKREREKTFYHSQKYYTSISNHFYGQTIMQFHLPDNTSFLRLHKPDHFGDNLAEYRESMNMEEKENNQMFFFEMGKYGLFYRLMTPLYNHGKFLGTFEIGVSANFFMNIVYRMQGVLSSVLIDKDHMPKELIEDHPIIKDRYVEVNNNSEIFKEFYKSFYGNANDGYFEFEDKYYDFRDQYPIFGLDGKEVGHFVFLFDNTKIHSLLEKQFLKTLMLGGFLVVMIMLVTRLGFMKSIKELEIDHKLLYDSLNGHNMLLQAKVEEEVQKNSEQQAHIAHQKRLADMGEMLCAIAHHWRQPLNAIGLYVQDVQDAYQKGELTDEYINIFTDDSMKMIMHMSKIIDDFQSSMRPDESKQYFVVLTELAEISHIMSSYWKARGIVFTFMCDCSKGSHTSSDVIALPDCEYDQTLLYGYRKEFKQVILSLLQNSVYAINERITKGETDKGVISLVMTKTVNEIILKISDNGGGFPVELMDKVFNPYFSTKDEGKGTGLGLHIARVLIEEQMDGKISAYNELDGAVIQITLPYFQRYSIEDSNIK
jgi:signal transduction histidine kinase